jgi:protein-S-isoprenylcysteine O-methyltransferase Ste14
MTWIFRQLFAIAVLPFTVAVIIPVWLARRNAIGLAPGHTLTQVAVQACGVALLGLGLLLFSASLRRFITESRGTLAPWDPPRHLVIAGVYRYVRNPMISGVLLVVIGEALLLLSWPHATWALIFFVINAIYIPLIEEPRLAERFGESYRDYCRHVPRLLPRWPPRQSHS